MTTYYLRTSVGPCGPGDQEELLVSAGASATTKALDGTGDTWTAKDLFHQTIPAGNWQVVGWYDSTSGGGPPPDMRVLVQVRNAACGIKQTIVDEVVGLGKGQTASAFVTTPVNPGQVEVAEFDHITVTLFHSNGTTSVPSVRYDGSGGGTSDTRLTHPNRIIHVAAYVNSAEMEVPDAVADARADVSFAELEVPDVSGRADLSFAELEIPDAQARADLSFAELEVPDAQARADVSFAELEVPNVSARADISFAELEIPDAQARADLSFAELEIPDAQARADLSFAELEVPDPVGSSFRADISFVEMEVPDVTVVGRADLSFAELQLPNPSAGDSLPNVFTSVKTFNDDLLRQELEEIGLPVDDISYLGFIFTTPEVAEAEDTEAAPAGTMELFYSIILSSDDIAAIQAVLDNHDFSDSSSTQASDDGDGSDLGEIVGFWNDFRNLTAEQKDEALRLALRMVVRNARGDEDMLDGAVRVLNASFETPDP